MKIIGIDLSGPANYKDTVMVVFQVQSDLLIFKKAVIDASDKKIISVIKEIAAHTKDSDRD